MSTTTAHIRFGADPPSHREETASETRKHAEHLGHLSQDEADAQHKAVDSRKTRKMSLGHALDDMHTEIYDLDAESVFKLADENNQGNLNLEQFAKVHSKIIEATRAELMKEAAAKEKEAAATKRGGIYKKLAIATGCFAFIQLILGGALTASVVSVFKDQYVESGVVKATDGSVVGSAMSTYQINTSKLGNQSQDVIYATTKCYFTRTKAVEKGRYVTFRSIMEVKEVMTFRDEEDKSTMITMTGSPGDMALFSYPDDTPDEYSVSHLSGYHRTTGFQIPGASNIREFATMAKKRKGAFDKTSIAQDMRNGGNGLAHARQLKEDRALAGGTSSLRERDDDFGSWGALGCFVAGAVCCSPVGGLLVGIGCAIMFPSELHRRLGEQDLLTKAEADDYLWNNKLDQITDSMCTGSIPTAVNEDVDMGKVVKESVTKL